MKIWELMTIYRPLFAKLTRKGVSMDDIMYLDMTREYNRMLSEGKSSPEIQRLLAQEYKVSPSAIKRAVKRLNEEFEL